MDIATEQKGCTRELQVTLLLVHDNVQCYAAILRGVISQHGMVWYGMLGYTMYSVRYHSVLHNICMHHVAACTVLDIAPDSPMLCRAILYYTVVHQVVRTFPLCSYIFYSVLFALCFSIYTCVECGRLGST